MAILKKGILGTPRGKIGNLMGYTRNGKGILQTVPTVSDPVSRIWNIYRASIKNQIGEMYDNLNTGRQAGWINQSSPNQTGRENCIETNMAYYDIKKQNTVGGGILTWSSIVYPIIVLGEMDWSTELMTLDFPQGFSWWGSAPVAKVSIKAYATNGNVSSVLRTLPNMTSTRQTVDVSQIINPNRLWCTVTPVQASPYQANREFLTNPFRFV